MKDFLACTEFVTLVHHVKTADSDSYVCYPIQGVSWYAIDGHDGRRKSGQRL